MQTHNLTAELGTLRQRQELCCRGDAGWGTQLWLAPKRLNLPNRSVRPSLRIYLLSAFQEHMDKIPLSGTYIYSIYY